MYTQVEKTKENKSRGVANLVAQKKRTERQGFGFVDNRPEVIAQRKLQAMVNNYSDSHPIQKKENKSLKMPAHIAQLKKQNNGQQILQLKIISSIIQGQFRDDGIEFYNTEDNTLDGFLENNNLDSELFTPNGYRDMTKRYRKMREDAALNADNRQELDDLYDESVRIARIINANFRNNAWKVGSIEKNTRYELPLKWNGRHGGPKDKTLHCSFRHVLDNYVENRFASKLLNTMVDQENDFNTGFLAYSNHLIDSFKDDKREIDGAVANTHGNAGAIDYEVDMGLSADAGEIHAYPVATGALAVTINQNTHNHLKEALYVYYKQKNRTDLVVQNWNTIRTDVDVVRLIGPMVAAIDWIMTH